jgi:hypothetical protein
MSYRFVLFISPEAGLDRADLIGIDERIVGALSLRHPVRDHDLGRGHLKIVAHTDDPQAAWETAKPMIPEAVLPATSAFYSTLGERKEHLLWPPVSNREDPLQVSGDIVNTRPSGTKLG